MIYRQYAEWLVRKMPLGPRWSYQQIYAKIAERYADPNDGDVCRAIEYLIASRKMTIVATGEQVRFKHWPYVSISAPAELALPAASLLVGC